MRTSARLRILLAVLVPALTIGGIVFYSWRATSEARFVPGTAWIESYWVSESDPRSLVIASTTGYGDVITGSFATEDQNTVTLTVSASVFTPPTGQMKRLAGYGNRTWVTLKEPLGDRVVRETSGRIVPRAAP
jgi:hypothetical protein